MSQIDPTCGALPPNVGNPIACHLTPGHSGPHFSTTGCAGSEIRWTTEGTTTEPSPDARDERHSPVDHHGRTVCSCGDFNCASLDGPDPRDVIARVLSVPDWGAWSPEACFDHNRWTFDGMSRTDIERRAYRDPADALLAAIGTDPAVTQALLDTLVAAGVLSEVSRWVNPNVRGLHGLTGIGPERPGGRSIRVYEDDAIQHRLVTEWAEVSD